MTAKPIAVAFRCVLLAAAGLGLSNLRAQTTNSTPAPASLVASDTNSYIEVPDSPALELTNELTNLYGATNTSPAVLAVDVPPPCDPPPVGLVSWWRAENDLLDAWGNNDARLGYSTYSISYTAGKVGRAFNFSGSTSAYLRAPDALSLRFTNALTIEAWVLPSAQQTSAMHTIVAKWGLPSVQFPTGLGITNSSFFLGTTNNGALCLLASPNNAGRSNVLLVAPAPLPVAQWSQVAATYDGVVLRLYVNGSLAAQAHYSAGLFPSTADLGIGAIPAGGSGGLYAEGSWPWLGALDELSLYDRALSDGEILALYSADVSGKCLLPPNIIVQPRNQAIPLGEDVLFSPTIQGTKPIAYQWRFNGQNLPGATSATLLLEKVQSNRMGNYSVMVSNVLGHVVSSNALLTLLPPPVCVSPPPGMVNWWPADGSPVDAAGTNRILSSPLYVISYHTGKVDRAFVLTNSAPAFYNTLYAPSSPALNFGSNADFSIEAWLKYIPPAPRLSPPYVTAPGPVQTIVVKQTASQLQPPLPIAGPTVGYSLSLDQGRLACWLSTARGRVTNSASFVSDGPDLRDGMFHHVALTLDRSATNGGNLYVDGQVVLTFDPTPMVGSLSNSGAFYISSSDTPFYGLIDELTLYSRALGTGEVLAIRQAGAAGKCKVPPYIVTQPTNQFVNLGADAMFSVAAAGSGLMHYQWRFNNLPLPWGTGASLTVTNAQQAGTYSVVVTNAFGSTRSASALLTLNHPPIAQCTNVTVAAGPDCLASASVDNQSLDPDQDNITLTQTPPGPYPVGTNVVTLTATDPYGLSNSCTALVLVVDQTPPVIVCPADIVVTNAHAAWTSVVTFNPTATDNCSGVGLPVCDPASGSAFSLGGHRVSCSVADAAGNTNQCSFTITVLPGNVPPVPVIQIAPLASFPGDTNLVVIAPVCASNAPVYFDASKSYDPDDATFNYAWYEGTNCFSTGPVATNQLSLGQHEIVLRLDDTFPLGTNSATVTVNIISAVQAVAVVSNLVSSSALAPNRQHPLQVSLTAAAAAFGRCDLDAGLNQLQAFQNKVRAQVAPSDSALADALLQTADQLLTALTPTTIAARPGLKLQSLARQPNGKVRLKFAGPSPRVPLVQASTNLQDWTTIGLATDTGDGSITFDDARAAGLPSRFYRVISP